ncbi:MAG: hypothetical protein PHO32_06135 [Candidatus Cloacimonetes bacterium]|nr:hypothetical protein [Candidatus Cloacimonadota bacterium]
MKKISILLFLVTLALGLFAQSGLFDLSYAIKLVEADSIMVYNGFVGSEPANNMVKYTPAANDLVSAIILFVEPKTQRMIGWFVKYNSENTEENDDYVVRTLAKLHGETNHFDDDTQQLIWYLSTTRTVHVMYSADNSLTVLYYDSHFPELFKTHKTPESEQPEVIKSFD